MNAIHMDRLEYADSSKLNVVERQESSGYNPKYLFWTLTNQEVSTKHFELKFENRKVWL